MAEQTPNTGIHDIYTVSEAVLPDGRSFEHSREQFQLHHAAARERDTHIGAVLTYWRQKERDSGGGVPLQDDFRPAEIVPQASGFLALVDVSSEDPNDFKLLDIGSEAIGLRGFSSGPKVSIVFDRIHCTLLIDLLWSKMDRQPSYFETEVIVQEATLRYVYCLLPTQGGGRKIDRVHVATRPVRGARATVEAFY